MLIVAAGTVFALTRPGDVSNPDVEFRAEPTDTPVPDATKPPKKGEKDPLDDFVWAHYGYSKDRRRYLPASMNLRPPYYRVWSVTGQGPARVRPGPGRQEPVPAQEQRLALRDRQEHWARALEAQARLPGRRLARLRRRHGVRDAAPARPPHPRRPRDRAARLRRQDPLEPPAAEPQRVLAAARRRPRLLRLGERHRLLAAHGRRLGALEVQGQGRGQGGARAGRRQAVLRRLQRAASTRSGPTAARSPGRRARAARASASAAGSSTRRPRSPTAASTSATPTATSTATRPTTASSPGASTRTATSTRRRRSRRSPAARRPSTSAPTRARSTRSTRARAACAGASTRTARSPARRPSWATSSTSRRSTARTRSASARAPGGGSSTIGRGAYNPVVSDGRTIFLNGYSSLYALRPLSAKGEVKAAKRRTDSRRASRAACLRKAERYHTHRRTIRRSYYRCVRRHHAQRR